MNGSDDTALLEDLRHGSREAVAAAVHQHNRSLWRIARGILGDDSDAEDAVQEPMCGPSPRSIPSAAMRASAPGSRASSSTRPCVARNVVS